MNSAIAIDPGTPFGAHVLARLRDEELIWLTTVATDGTPQPNPVWFYWDGSAVVIYTEPNAAKLRNVGRNPRVALHFEAGAGQEDVVVITGKAQVERNVPAHDPRYVDKYAEGLREIGFHRDGYAVRFSVAIRVKPEKARGLAPL